MANALDRAFPLQQSPFTRNRMLGACPLVSNDLSHPPQVLTVPANLPPNLQEEEILCYKLAPVGLSATVPTQVLIVRLHPPMVPSRRLKHTQLRQEKLVPLDLPKNVLVVPTVLLQCPRLAQPHTVK